MPLQNHESVRQQQLTRRITRLQRHLARLQQRSSRLSRARLVVFFVGFMVALLIFVRWGPVPWLAAWLVAMVPFGVLVAIHRRVDTAVTRYTIWLDIQRSHLARLTLDWDHLPPPPPIPPRFDHPFALDLDLVGDRSIHHLLDTAVTEEGSLRLRQWLLAVEPDTDKMRQRQGLTQELAAMPLFRDKLTLNARIVAATAEKRWPGRQLLDWLHSQPENPRLRPLALVLSFMAAINIIIFFLVSSGILTASWLWVWLPYVALYSTQWLQVGNLFNDVLFLDDSLRRLNTIFHFLESSHYGRYPQLNTLCQPLLDPQKRPSAYIRRLQRVVAAVGIRQNPFLALLINMIVPWDVVVGLVLQKQRLVLKDLLPSWLEIWFELEALASLATFSALHPGHVYPEVRSDTAVAFQAQALGHPLIPGAARVRNDFAVRELGEVAIITGSNMSGKSTFLRTIGVNLALAYAGGVVDAALLATRPFRLFSSIRVTDSVTDGFSFFYAEVRRLQQLRTELKRETAVPLFYFVDEIFRGTNNRERLLGSRAYIRDVNGGNGIGLVATHDLELVKLAEEITAVTNYHFRDDVADGRMVFDYTLRPGPCPTTNALKIMAQAGLPVPEDAIREK